MEPFKTCTCCGRTWTHTDWLALPLLGVMAGVEMRNCTCQGTMAIDRTEDEALR